MLLNSAKFLLIFVLSLWSVEALSYVYLSNFQWKDNGNGTGVVTAVSATSKDANQTGPCNSSPANDTCKIYVGNGFTSYPDSLTLLFSGPNTANNDTQAVSAVNASRGTTFRLLSDDAKVCIYYTRYNGATFMPLSGGVCSGGVIPPTPTPASCNINGDVIIDYGTLSVDTLPGMHKTGTTTITCDKQATVNLRVYNKGDSTNVVSLRDDKSLSAKLTVDGVDVSKKGKDITVKANTPVTVTIDSELAVSGVPSAGEFSGSAIALISIP